MGGSLKNYILVDLDVATVGIWDKSRNGDLARGLMQKISEKEFYMATPVLLIERISKWENMDLKIRESLGPNSFRFTAPLKPLRSHISLNLVSQVYKLISTHLFRILHNFAFSCFFHIHYYHFPIYKPFGKRCCQVKCQGWLLCQKLRIVKIMIWQFLSMLRIPKGILTSPTNFFSPYFHRGEKNYPALLGKASYINKTHNLT